MALRKSDALIDSMIWGGINAIDPPYKIKISGLESVPKDVYEHVDLAKRAIADARTEYCAAAMPTSTSISRPMLDS
jgi:hypothetical protein